MGRRPGYRQEQVLKAAVELFRANGFHRVSVEDVVEATGLNRFALYEKFGGKEGLFYAAMEYYHRVAIRRGLLGPLHAPDASLETVLAMLRTVKGFNLDTTRPPGCMIVNANTELGGGDERVAAEYEYVHATFREAVAHALTRAAGRGELGTARTPADLAEYAAVMIRAFFSLAYLSREAADEIMTRLLEECRSWGRAPAAAAGPSPAGARAFQNARAGLAAGQA